MQIQRTQGVLPHVGYNTLTLGARGFSCAVSGFGILGNFRRTRFLLTRLTAPGSPTPRMPFPLSREKREPLVMTLGLGTILFTFVETLVTLRPLRRSFTYLQVYANLNIGKGEDKQTRGKVK